MLLFSKLRVSCCMRSNLQPNELQLSNLLQYDIFTAQVMGKSPLLPWKISTRIMVRTPVLYRPQKIHLLLKFIDIDKISVKLLQKYTESDCLKLKKLRQFQETSALHLIFQSIPSELAKSYLLLCLHLPIILVRLFNIFFL